MKSFLPGILFLAVAMPAYAQPTVNSGTLPVAGFSATVQFSTTSTPFAPGPSGANATWNFSTAPTGNASTINYAACPGASGCSTFPNTNLKGLDNNNSSSFFSVLNGIQAITGYSIGGQDIVYSNPEDYIRTPMTYNSTFTDPFAATLSGGTSIYRVGSVTNLVDGYGTLITAAGTFNNVLRVKRTSAYRDSIPGFGAILTYTSTTYLWYSPSIRDYLFVIASLTSTPAGGGSGSTTNTVSYRTNPTATVHDAATAGGFFQASPNPAQDRLALRWDDQVKATATLTDLTGRTLMRQVGQGAASFRVDALPRGLYVLRLEEENGATRSEKVTLR